MSGASKNVLLQTGTGENYTEVVKAVNALVVEDADTPAAGDVPTRQADGTNKWEPGSGGGVGDMTKTVYDPTAVADDAFSMANMAETATKKVLTSTERSAISANSSNLTKFKTVQIDFVVPGAFMAGRSAGDDLLDLVNKHVFEWLLSAGVLISLRAIVGVDDTGGTQPSINIEIAGTEALSSDLTLAESWQSGTVDTDNDDVANDATVKITVADAGTNEDAEDLTVSTTWSIT